MDRKQSLHGHLDPIAIAAELGQARPRDPRPVTGGSGAAIWRVETDDGPVAVRVFAAAQQAVADHERQALAVVAGTAIPVPAVLGAGTPASAEGRPTTILGWCDGTTMLERLGTATGSEAGWLGALLGTTQAAIHRVAPPVEWGPDPDDRLLHFDLHPANLMIAGREVTGVLDWVNAKAGDPRRDVARTYSMFVADPAATALRRQRPDAVQAFRQGWLAGYERAAGRVVGLGPFIAEAGEFMRRDLAGRLDREQLETIERWTDRWRVRADPSGR